MRRSICILLLWISVFSLRSQSIKPDEILQEINSAADTQKVNLYIRLSIYYSNNDFKKGIDYAQKANDLSKKINFKRGEAFSNYSIAENYYVERKYSEAQPYYDKALQIYTALNDNNGIANTKKSMGAMLHKKGNNKEGLAYCLEALTLLEQTKNKEVLASTYINIGLIYDDSGDLDKAIDYYKKAITYAEEVRNYDDMASCYNNMGSIYTDQKKIDLAIECYNRSYKLKEQEGNKVGMASTLNNLGAAYFQMHNFDKALDFFKRSYDLRLEIGDKNGIYSSLNNIGSLYYEKGDYSNALDYFRKSEEVAKRTGERYFIMSSYENMWPAYQKLGDFKSALDCHLQFSLYKDSLYNIENSKNIAEIKTKFESEKKHQENEILNLQLKNESFIKYIFIALAGLLLLTAFFIFRSLRQNQKVSHALEEKNLIIEEQNKDITDSIKYAKHIQEAILPPLKLWQKIFPESFILYLPKDILSGDFYWVQETTEFIFVAAADCTGHGVPGALVSIVNYNLLDKAVLEKNLTEPAQILTEVNKWLTESLHQSYNVANVRDGMDIALCSINKKTKQVQYAGAFNPVYIFSGSTLSVAKGDKFPVGAFIEEKINSFTNNILPVKAGDTIYMFSDGYSDQFGGPKGKKLKYKQLQSFLSDVQNLPLSDQEEVLLRKFNDWKGNNEQVDDVLILGIKIT